MTTLSRLALAMIATAIIASGCSGESAPDEIILLAHDSFALGEGTLDAFTEQTGVEVVVHLGGDTGAMVNQAILTKDNPIADVMYGVDNTFLSRAIDEGLFLPYKAEEVAAVEASLRVDGDAVTPIDFGDVCINYDIEALETAGIAPPQTLDDLISPTYASLLAVEDPATSSPGLAFLIATISAYPEGSEYDWHAYWADLFANDVSVSADWSSAYYAEFTRSGGTRPLVVSYASSPPAEVFFGELSSAPTGTMTEGCFRQIEYAGILAGTEHEATAQQLIDFLLSVPVQEDIPLNMFVYPANSNAALPQVFVQYTTFPETPVVTDPTTIGQNRDRWISEWTEIARG